MTAQLDSATAALVESLVQARLEDSDQQIAAQMATWKAQEEEMLNRETVMRKTVEELNARLAATVANETQTATRNSFDMQGQSSEIPMDSSHGSAMPSASSSTNVTESASGTRKRRRKAPVPVPDTAPARNTRSSRQASLDSTVTVTSVPLNHPVPSTGSVPPTHPVATTIPPVVPPSSRSGVNTRSGRPVAPLDTAPRNSAPRGNAPIQSTTFPPLSTFTFSNLNVNNWRSNPVVPAKEKKKNAAATKPAAQVHRFLPKDMPDDLGGLQKAMALHIRILWGLLDAKEVPKNPPSRLLSDFRNHFSSEADLFLSQESGRELVPRHLVQIGTAMSSAGGRIAKEARLVEEHMLSYIQACLSRFGLFCWCPDLRQTAYSLYNAACRIVALDTFKQALISQTYLHLNPNTTYTTNMPLLIRLYDHIVFHYMLLRYQRSNRNPESLMQELQSSPAYQNRIRLADARLKFLKENNYPQRYRDLIDSKATSDDEFDSNQKAWLIKRRPERSAKAEMFIRRLDQIREIQARQDQSRKWRQRLRIVPSNQQDTTFHALPEGMPIDYFDPEFFNVLQPKARNRVAIPKVSLLPTIADSFTWRGEEHMSDAAFTRKYGAEVFSLYNMVSHADLVDADDEWMDNDDEEENTEEDDDIDEDDDIAEDDTPSSYPHLSDLMLPSGSLI